MTLLIEFCESLSITLTPVVVKYHKNCSVVTEHLYSCTSRVLLPSIFAYVTKRASATTYEIPAHFTLSYFTSVLQISHNSLQHPQIDTDMGNYCRGKL